MGHLKSRKSLKITPAFQPVRDAQGKTVFYEVLARVSDEAGKSFPIDQYVAERERKGTIAGFDLEMLSKSLETLRERPDVHLSWNVSPQSLSQINFRRAASTLFARYNREMPRLGAELLETVPLNIFAARDFINDVHRYGGTVKLDDCGVHNFVHIDHLRALRVDGIKIDKAIINEQVPDATKILNHLLAEARHNKYSVTAEGIEDGTSIPYLSVLGINNFQGYYNEGRPAFTMPQKPVEIPARALPRRALFGIPVAANG